MNKNSWIAVVVIIVLFIAGFIWYGQSNPNASSTVNSPTPTVSPTSSSKPTPLQVDVPIVVTSSNVLASDTTAIISGTVIPDGALTNYWFEYGTSNTLGKTTSKQSAG